MPPENNEITLGILSAVSRDDRVTQRFLATELGIALGLANAYLRRCVNTGLIKVQQIPANRYGYYLTPTGFAEKSRLAAEYFSQSLQLFRVARQQLDEILRICHDSGWSRVALWGMSDLTEIALLCATDLPVTLVGVVDRAGGQSGFRGLSVATELSGLAPHDAVVITALAGAQEAFDEAASLLPVDRVLAPPFLAVVGAPDRSMGE
ncbi:winged helix-turn-helix transcriptional regulator [Magnetospirillum sp. 15-1]|uniref:winged helix-turn-helix transcriptional regulator n=1 Tax=Magnetospirillum sp. 15-1 TaxID=1979370 RepID=UPI000BBB852F|nr:winged helix-turn-helix transcriptional regulator [Magnetospirillum sp. 15-1]